MTPARLGILGAALCAVAACGHAKPAPATRASAANGPALVADPQLIEMSVDPTASLVPASASSKLGVRVQIHALDLPAARRPAVNLTLVLDTSGSMAGKPIAALRTSARSLIERMRDGDRVAVIAFHSRVDLLVPNTPIDATARERISKVIDRITARGTTDLAAGLAAGLQQVQAGLLRDGINRIVMFSDGVPNTAAALPTLIASAHQTGIGVTTLGFGIDYDSTLLTRIARDTGGTFRYVETPEAVASVFDSELSKMTTVVGRNLQLALAPGPGVTIEAMPGLTIGADGKAYATIGDLAAGERRDLMIPIRVAARGDGSIAELVDVALAFDDVINRSGRQQRDGFATAAASDDALAVRQSVKIDLEVQRIRTAAASAVLDAIAFARQGQLDQGRKRIVDVIELVRAATTRLQDPELAKMVAQLEELIGHLAQLTTPIDVQVPAGDAKPVVAPASVEVRLRRTEERAAQTVRGAR